MMDKGHHRSKFHHTPAKITLDIWRDKALVFNYILPDIDNRLSVFILVLLSLSPTLKLPAVKIRWPIWNPQLEDGGKYRDAIIFHKISKGDYRENNLKTASWDLGTVILSHK